MSAESLTAFVAARLDEDEQRARGYPPEGRTWPRALREVEAKRAILRMKAEAKADRHSEWDDMTLGAIIEQVAAVWSDHPDYRPEWAP